MQEEKTIPVFARDDFVEDISTKEAVAHLLLNLDHGDRKLLTLRYLEGYSQGEIARSLCISNATVSRRLRFALQKAKDLYVI